MILAPLRWLFKNFSTLILAFLLSLVVWVSAVLSVDPNVEDKLNRRVEIEYIQGDPNLKQMGTFPETVAFTLIAPQSVWNEINNDPTTIRAWVDLAGLKAGEHTLPVQVEITPKLAKIVAQDPLQVTIRLEALISKTFDVELSLIGKPPLGYQADTPVIEPSQITVSGPESLVNKVQTIRTQVDISSAVETVERLLNVSALDENGRVVNGVTLTPTTINGSVPIRLQGGYRNVIVKVVTTGIVASGYRLTNYLVTPDSLVVFSSNPRLVEQLPGYIETIPLDLTGADNDFEVLLELNLPEGVTAVADSKVLVQVSIAAIETSLTITLPVEVIGLAPGFEANVAPAMVDLILTGPVPVLNNLQASDIRVVVNLEDIEAGSYQLTPLVDFLPPEVREVSILPASVEVDVIALPTPTPTRVVTQTPVRTLTATPTSQP